MTFDELMRNYEAKASEAKAANLQRYGEVMSIFDEIIGRYSPGGAFEKRALGQLETQKARDVGGETQQLISSGLYGTTTMGGVGRRWEESVGGPQRLALEDVQGQRLSQAQLGKAEAITAREDVGPDAGLYASLMQGAASRPGIVSAPAAPSTPLPLGLDSFGRPLSGSMQATEQAYKQWQMSGGGGSSPTSAGAYTGGAGGAAPTSAGAYTGGAGGAAPTSAGAYTGGAGGAAPAGSGSPITMSGFGPIATGTDWGIPTKPGGEAGSKTITMQHYRDRGTSKTKTVQVPSSALGSGPGGFKDERTYLKYMPSGYSPYKG